MTTRKISALAIFIKQVQIKYEIYIEKILIFKRFFLLSACPNELLCSNGRFLFILMIILIFYTTLPDLFIDRAQSIVERSLLTNYHHYYHSITYETFLS